MNFTKNIILLFFIYNCIAVSQETNYLDFEIIVEDNPYPSNIFIHNLSHVAPITGTMPRYMAIIDSTLNPAWVVHSGDLGLDFKAHVNKLSYFDYENKAWILLNEYMCEMDTLKCTEIL